MTNQQPNHDDELANPPAYDQGLSQPYIYFDYKELFLKDNQQITNTYYF